MADSTTNLDLISVSQAQKEVTANALFDAASPATVYGRRASTTSLLTWGYYGGRFNSFEIPNGTLTLTASQTNYIVASTADGAVSVSTSIANWNDSEGNYIRLYKVIAGSTSITSFEDHRTILSILPQTQPYDVVVWQQGQPAAGQTLMKFRATRPVVFPADFVGSQAAPADVQATDIAVFSIQKNGTQVGTATYPAAGINPTFASPADIELAVGDVLSIVAPAPADATLEGVNFVLLGSR
jgi:hypothetical protein